jgi:hypothetical protein
VLRALSNYISSHENVQTLHTDNLTRKPSNYHSRYESYDRGGNASVAEQYVYLFYSLLLLVSV